jgi:hypothetical protein
MHCETVRRCLAHEYTALVIYFLGRVIAQAVGRWLATAAARFRVRAEDVEFVVDRVALGQVFYEYFSFSYQSSFNHFLHHHNHLGLAQYAYWWLHCPNWTLTPPPLHYSNLKYIFLTFKMAYPQASLVPSFRHHVLYGSDDGV